MSNEDYKVPEKKYISWEDVNTGLDKIYEQVKMVRFKPDRIIGIIRGGQYGATYLSNMFRCDVSYIHWSFIDSDVQDLDQINSVLLGISAGEKVLFFDDIVDSGKTIKTIKEALGLKPFSYMNDPMDNQVQFSALYFNYAQKEASVDHLAHLINRDYYKNWLVFPWEVEDEYPTIIEVEYRPVFRTRRAVNENAN